MIKKKKKKKATGKGKEGDLDTTVTPDSDIWKRAVRTVGVDSMVYRGTCPVDSTA